MKEKKLLSLGYFWNLSGKGNHEHDIRRNWCWLCHSVRAPGFWRRHRCKVNQHQDQTSPIIIKMLHYCLTLT